MTAQIWFWWAVVAVGSFAVLEGIAIVTGTDTLSAVVRGMATTYPWTVGAISVGGLVLLSHFYLGWP